MLIADEQAGDLGGTGQIFQHRLLKNKTQFFPYHLLSRENPKLDWPTFDYIPKAKIFAIFNPNLYKFTDTGFLTPAYDGQSIGGTKDAKLNGVTWTESTNKPIFKSDIINNRPSVLFDGVNDKVLSGTIAHNIGTAGDYHFITLIKKGTDATAYHGICCNSGGSPLFYSRQSADAHVTIYNGGFRAFSKTLTNNSWYVLNAARVSGTLKLYINGIQDATTFADVTNTANTAFGIGYDGGGVAFYDSHIAFVCFFGTITETERMQANLDLLKYTNIAYGAL